MITSRGRDSQYCLPDCTSSQSPFPYPFADSISHSKYSKNEIKALYDGNTINNLEISLTNFQVNESLTWKLIMIKFSNEYY